MLFRSGLKEPVIHVGNLNASRDFTDVRDVVKAYILAVNKCDYGEEYNIGVKNPITVGEFLKVLLSYAKVNIPCEQDTNLLRPVDVTLQVPDVSKFENKTGWKPKYTLNESIEFLLEYYRNII